MKTRGINYVFVLLAVVVATGLACATLTSTPTSVPEPTEELPGYQGKTEKVIPGVQASAPRSPVWLASRSSSRAIPLRISALGETWQPAKASTASQ